MTLNANNQPVDENDLSSTAQDDDDLSTTAPNPADDDLSTTAPNPPNESVWKMPEPVFRKTSGRLPQGFEKDLSDSGMSGQSVPPSEPSPSPSAASALSPPVVQPKSSVVKLVLVVLGMIGMIAFLVVFLSLVYYFFLR